MLNIVMTRAGEAHVTIRIHNLDANQGTLNNLVQNPANAITPYVNRVVPFYDDYVAHNVVWWDCS